MLKKEARIKEKTKQELAQLKELISFLKSQVKTNLDKPKFYSVENSPALNAIREELKKCHKMK